MGPTYLKRLWCIWEIFTLFCFCNDELAAERIEILPLIDTNELIEQLETFNIDEAHCFDPNEEYKLRYLMLEVIGMKKLKRSIVKLKDILKSKIAKDKDKDKDKETGDIRLTTVTNLLFSKS